MGLDPKAVYVEVEVVRTIREKGSVLIRVTDPSAIRDILNSNLDSAELVNKEVEKQREEINEECTFELDSMRSSRKVIALYLSSSDGEPDLENPLDLSEL